MNIFVFDVVGLWENEMMFLKIIFLRSKGWKEITFWKINEMENILSVENVSSTMVLRNVYND